MTTSQDSFFKINKLIWTWHLLPNETNYFIELLYFFWLVICWQCFWIFSFFTFLQPLIIMLILPFWNKKPCNYSSHAATLLSFTEIQIGGGSKGPIFPPTNLIFRYFSKFVWDVVKTLEVDYPAQNTLSQSLTPSWHHMNFVIQTDNFFKILKLS